MQNYQLTIEILKWGNSESIPHVTNKVSPPEWHKEYLSVSQNLLYYSWNIFFHTEFWLHQKPAWAQLGWSAMVSPYKKKAGNTWTLPFRLPSKQAGYFCTSTKWNSKKGKLCSQGLARKLLSCLELENCLKTVEFREHKLPRQRLRPTGWEIQWMFESLRKASCQVIELCSRSNPLLAATHCTALELIRANLRQQEQT